LQQVVYGDVLVTTNFIINMLILRICALFGGASQRKAGKYFAAALGALCSFVIFVPIHSFWFDLTVRFAVSALVVLTAYMPLTLREFFKLTAVFYGASFLLAGAVIGLIFLLPTRNYIYNNGIIYINVSLIMLAGAVGMGYAFAAIFGRIFSSRVKREGIWRMIAYRDGAVVSFAAMADTGNVLRESFSGKPIVILDSRRAEILLSEEERSGIREGMWGENMPPSLRPVLSSTAAGEAVLWAFLPDKLTVQTANGERLLDAYIAIGAGKIGGEDYCAVFNPTAIEIQL